MKGVCVKGTVLLRESGESEGHAVSNFRRQRSRKDGDHIFDKLRFIKQSSSKEPSNEIFCICRSFAALVVGDKI